jgi:chitodextrinase
MRRAALPALVVCAATLIPAPSADAYRLQSHRWYSKTLTYHDATGRYRSEVRAAVREINRSGARVRVRSAPRSKARVQIRLDRRLPAAGRANYVVFGGIVSRAVVRLRADLAENFPSEPAARAGITAVIAHELGHVLGLDHENRRCANMNSSLWGRCRDAPERWRYRCRTLEADDVRGLVRRFGGRVRPRGPEFCDAEPAPGAPAVLSVVTADPSIGAVRLTWQMPARGVGRVRVLRRPGTCPTGPQDTGAQVIEDRESAAGRVETLDDYVPSPGRYCYAIVATGPLGRPGPLVTTVHDYLGEPPVARWRWFESDPRIVEFTDLSFDGDGRIAAWHWDFGDGTASADPNPVHAYAAPGTYQVTLTVTDDSGQAASATQTVQVVGSD